MFKMSNEDSITYYQDIVQENRYRLNIFKKYDLILFKEFSMYQYLMNSLAESLYNQISLSTTRIRRDKLKEPNIDKEATLYYSKSRIDRLKGARTERNNTISLKNKLLLNMSDSAYLFVTIDYIHSNDFLSIPLYLTTLKNIMKKFLHTSMFNQLDGLIVKYELSFGMYKNKLSATPHIHLILSLKPDLIESLKLSLTEYFKEFIHYDETSIDIKEIEKTDKSFKDISKYICKDFYTTVFHNKDKSITPYQVIMYTLLQTRNFRFINSYKNLNIK